MIQLAESSYRVYSYVKENGRVSVPEVADALGLTQAQVRGTLLSVSSKHGLVTKTKEAGPEGKDITFLEIDPSGDSEVSQKE